MPLLGLIPFLQLVNILSLVGVVVCQCPYSGLSHFYDETTSEEDGDKVCQCPYSGLSHFYNREKESLALVSGVSMPLLGLIPFLQNPAVGEDDGDKGVSMPLLGLIPFLRSQKSYSNLWFCMCQCPYSGLSHFYGIPFKTL